MKTDILTLTCVFIVNAAMLDINFKHRNYFSALISFAMACVAAYCITIKLAGHS